MGHALAGQQQLDLFDALAKAGHRIVRRAAEPAKLVRQKGTREPDIEAAVADRVQHADFAGELQRMVEDRQHRTRHQPRPARALSRGGEKQHWVGAVPAVVMKIMLDDADVGEPEFLRFFHQAKRITKILGAGFLLGPDVGKKLDAEFHTDLRAISGYTHPTAGGQPLAPPLIRSLPRIRSSDQRVPEP